MLDRVIKALGTILIVCLGVRLAAWFVTPAAVYAIGVILVLVVIVGSFMGPRARP